MLEEQRVRHREQRDFEFRVREQLRQQIRSLGGEPAPLVGEPGEPTRD